MYLHNIPAFIKYENLHTVVLQAVWVLSLFFSIAHLLQISALIDKRKSGGGGDGGGKKARYDD